MIIEWVTMRFIFKSTSLSNWMNQINLLIKTFKRISFSHIYREQNLVTNGIPKNSCSMGPDKIKFLEFEIGIFQCSGVIKI